MSYPEIEDLNQPVVIDNGSGVIKAGIAGQERPTAVVPACIGTPKHTRVMLNRPEAETFLGEDAMKHRGLLKLQYPIHHGIIHNVEQVTALCSHIYKKYIKTPIEEHPVLLTEPTLNPNKNSKQLSEIFFEQFNVPALYFSPPPILALYASGRITGTVVDSGHGVTQVVPIYEGFAVTHAIQRIDVGGDEVTKYLQHLLRKSGVTFHTSAEIETIRLLKEDKCELLAQRNIKIKEDDDQYVIRYKLPDGKILQIGSARHKAPEVLFDPSLIGLEYKGIHQCILDAISKSDLDLRKDLYNTILLSGGSTCIKGFGPRLMNELQSKSGKEGKIKIFAPVDRTLTTWIGGSMLSCMGSFQSMWIRQKEYRETGISILERKLFY